MVPFADPQKIIDSDNPNIEVLASRLAAGKDDLVFVLGKGDEWVMDYGSNKVPHRDIDVISQWAINS